MSKKSFKVKNSISLEETSRQVDSVSGEMYYDTAKQSFVKKSDYWSYLESKQDVAFNADITSVHLTASITENAIIKITGSPPSAFNLHGLARNNNAKLIHIYNDTNQKMVIKHQSVTETNSSDRIITPKTTDLSIAKKSLVIFYYDDSAGGWVANQASGGSGGTSFDQIQPAHGFTLFTPIYHDGTIWKKAQANASNTLATYVVTEFSTNAFTATKFGVIEAPSHGLTVGEFYYVSKDVAGDITITEPIFGYSNPVIYVQSTDLVHIMAHRPSLIGDGNVSDSEIGAVTAFAFTTEPVGYLLCDGRAISRVTYNELFNKIGITHGQGNGTTTFNLPDYRGRFLRGVDGTANRDPDKASRSVMAVGGNSGNNVGSVQGDDFLSHTHIQNSHTHIQDAHSHTVATQSAGVNGYASGPNSTMQPGSISTSSVTATNQVATAVNQNTGGNETRPKNAYVNYFIRFAAKGAIKGESVPSGTILDFGGATTALPTGYLVCDGSSLLRTDYPALFTAIGTNWGATSPAHFNLPDLRGRFTRGQNLGTGRDPDAATRTAINTGGATGDNVGSLQGDIFGSHTHIQNAHSHSTTTVGSDTPNTIWYNGSGGLTNVAATTGSATATNQNTGGNETRPKNAYVLKIIKY